MSDALTSNRPTVVESKQSVCNSHGRRQFYDVLIHFTDDVEEVLCLYGQIWVLNEESVEENHTEAERLRYHQKHSLPIMERIKRWGEAHLQNETVEENNGLGKAIRYFNKHYEDLTSFCKIEGAQLDNNLMEAQLKLVVRDRKNAMFHNTLTGSLIGDVIAYMIATANQANINVFEYFNWLQRENEKVLGDPEYYLPWNYQKNHIKSSF
jgi:transposase